MYIRVEIGYFDFFFSDMASATKFIELAHQGHTDKAITMYIITEESYLDSIQAKGA